MTGGASITQAIERARRSNRAAIAAFLTAGYPDRERFIAQLVAVAREVDIVEIGVPFSDPMADGVSVQRASRVALEQGTTLRWILATLTTLRHQISTPLLLMSYLNPLLRYGVDALGASLRAAGIAGLIVPDLPLEEQSLLDPTRVDGGVALVQLVTPVTPPERLRRLGNVSEGFVYAVTVTGVTGGALIDHAAVRDYLQQVKAVAAVPVLAGFGVRSAADVARLVPPADGVIVGSALLDAIERGADPAQLARQLRTTIHRGDA